MGWWFAPNDLPPLSTCHPVWSGPCPHNRGNRHTQLPQRSGQNEAPFGFGVGSGFWVSFLARLARGIPDRPRRLEDDQVIYRARGAVDSRGVRCDTDRLVPVVQHHPSHLTTAYRESDLRPDLGQPSSHQKFVFLFLPSGPRRDRAPPTPSADNRSTPTDLSNQYQ